MIQPLNSNISFRANEKPEKTSKIKTLVNGALGVVKTYNNVTSTTGGFVRGAVEGAVAVGVCTSLARNIKNSNGQILGTLKGVTKDAFHLAKNVVKSSPSLLTKAPVENLKNLGLSALKFYKNNKTFAGISSVIGVMIIALRTLQGKLNANAKNADIDHKTQTGHNSKLNIANPLK